jgi:hypothetical protein
VFLPGAELITSGGFRTHPGLSQGSTVRFIGPSLTEETKMKRIRLLSFYLWLPAQLTSQTCSTTSGLFVEMGSC